MKNDKNLEKLSNGISRRLIISVVFLAVLIALVAILYAPFVAWLRSEDAVTDESSNPVIKERGVVVLRLNGAILSDSPGVEKVKDIRVEITGEAASIIRKEVTASFKNKIPAMSLVPAFYLEFDEGPGKNSTPVSYGFNPGDSLLAVEGGKNYMAPPSRALDESTVPFLGKWLSTALAKIDYSGLSGDKAKAVKLLGDLESVVVSVFARGWRGGPDEGQVPGLLKIMEDAHPGLAKAVEKYFRPAIVGAVKSLGGDEAFFAFRIGSVLGIGVEEFADRITMLEIMPRKGLKYSYVSEDNKMFDSELNIAKYGIKISERVVIARALAALRFYPQVDVGITRLDPIFSVRIMGKGGALGGFEYYPADYFKYVEGTEILGTAAFDRAIQEHMAPLLAEVITGESVGIADDAGRPVMHKIRTVLFVLESNFLGYKAGERELLHSHGVITEALKITARKVAPFMEDSDETVRYYAERLFELAVNKNFSQGSSNLDSREYSRQAAIKWWKEHRKEFEN